MRVGLALGLVVIICACGLSSRREGEPPEAARSDDQAVLAAVAGISGEVLSATWASVPGVGRALLALIPEHRPTATPSPARLYLVSPDGSRPPRPLAAPPSYSFWSVSAGDVDGDGVEEVGLCTYSRTVRDPQYARRFFVYAWNDAGDLRPLWRGSRLCRPYLTAALMDVAGDARAELVSVEVALSGRRVVVAYEWNQFGFWGLGMSEEYDGVTVEGACEGGGGVKAIRVTTTGADGARCETALALRAGALVSVPHIKNGA